MRARAGRREEDERPEAQLSAAALALVERHAGQIMATARRYAATAEDAEDAYQRGLEIMLTKAPSTAEDQLVPWLKTVVKHEAFALRRQRDRHTPTADDGEPPERPGGPPAPEQAERLERLQVGAEALAQLKPQEVRALLLRAEGHSYDEIARICGWTYTKVNRCLTEGRRAFLKRIDGIEAGDECERLAPHLSALADGEASAEDMKALRTHLKTCLACRAQLREFRAAPARVAALMPPAVLVASSDVGGPLRAGFESLAAGLSDRVGQGVELVSGSKVAAVAASAAIVAGGGAATVSELSASADPVRPHIVRQQAKAKTPALPPELADQAAGGAVAPTAPKPGQASAPPVDATKALGIAGGGGTAAAPAPSAPAPAPAPRPPDPADEFAPGGGSVASAGGDSGGGGGEFTAGGGGGSGGGGEFGP
ncbi:MAG TPA: sigma-70 family RNA polymerase sigma factor [Thermoleophilaceae bacterium]|nr:sigma-70 family RNA polymerase sigma factor [Thermoleophilaceae bacterium]